jgi:hypothetical protein
MRDWDSGALWFLRRTAPPTVSTTPARESHVKSGGHRTVADDVAGSS